jgi:hypothetical protein
MPHAVRFVETMTGAVAPCPPTRLPDWYDDPVGFDARVVQASSGVPDPAGTPLGVHDLALAVATVATGDDGLPGRVWAGTVQVGEQRYRVDAGRFLALAASPVHGRRLRYRISGRAGTGERVDLAGVKVVTGRPWRWWADTSRMYVYLLVSTEDGEVRAAAGTVRLGIGAFARQLTTLRGRPADVLVFLGRFMARLVLPPSRS